MIVWILWNQLWVYVIPALALFLAVVAFYLLHQKPQRGVSPPGPWGVPVLGYLPFLNPQAPYLSLAKLTEKYGKIYSLCLGSVPAVVLADPKLIRLALAKEEFSGRPPLPITHGIMGGFGIIGAEGAWWKEQRRFLVNTFHSLGTGRNSSQEQRMLLQSVIKRYLNVLLQEISSSSGSPIDPHPLLGHLFANVVSHLIFGRDFDLDDVAFIRQIELVDAGFKKVNIMGTLNFLPFLKYVPYFKHAFEDVMESKEEHHQFLRACLSNLTNASHDVDCYANAFKKRMQDKSKDTFVEEQLMHALADIFGAGLETSRVTTEWFLLFMASFQNIQRHVQEELDATDENDYLPYTEACILETQRLGNLVPLGAPHGTTQDAKFEGYFIPKGTMVIPLLWYVHMDPSNWSNPEIFDPTRFLDDNRQLVKHPCFMPFSAGRRMCPGDDLARMELLLTVTSLLRHYSILPPSEHPLDLRPQMGFTLTPNHFTLRFIPRANSC